MKKLFLFTCLSAFALSFNSCSDDDSSSSGNDNETTISFKVNGVQKTFKHVVFEGETGSEVPYHYIEAIPNSNEPSESVNFTFHGNEIGSDVIEHFHYKKGSFDYYWTRGQDTEFMHNFQTNTTTKVKGTFSGTIHDGDESVTITNGTFNINQTMEPYSED